MEKGIYKGRKKILSLVIILLLCNMITAQENLPKKTVSTEKVQKEQKIDLKTENKQIVTEGTASQKAEAQQENDKKKRRKVEETSQVKQVKGSTPDMSKAKGARPPYIVRPSGSGMPKGAGKPGGAIKPGRR